jgi:hypothetical protein
MQNIPGLIRSGGLLRHYAGRGKDQKPAQTESGDFHGDFTGEREREKN